MTTPETTNPHTAFTFRGKAFRLANQEEITAAQSESGAPHILYGCTACGESVWSAKNLTLADSGGYISIRNVFYCGDHVECSCSLNALRYIVQAEA